MLQMGALRDVSRGNTPEQPPGKKSQDTERGITGSRLEPADQPERPPCD